MAVSWVRKFVCVEKMCGEKRESVCKKERERERERGGGREIWISYWAAILCDLLTLEFIGFICDRAHVLLLQRDGVRVCACMGVRASMGVCMFVCVWCEEREGDGDSESECEWVSARVKCEGLMSFERIRFCWLLRNVASKMFEHQNFSFASKTRFNGDKNWSSHYLCSLGSLVQH